MRYNERVEIITNQQEEYNPETGEYTSNEGERLFKSGLFPKHA